jgi:hypothetical protein
MTGPDLDAFLKRLAGAVTSRPCPRLAPIRQLAFTSAGIDLAQDGGSIGQHRLPPGSRSRSLPKESTPITASWV